jgi:hypothetical protein
VPGDINKLLDLQIDAYVDAIAIFRTVRAQLIRQMKDVASHEFLAVNKQTTDQLEEQLANLRRARFTNHPFAARPREKS